MNHVQLFNQKLFKVWASDLDDMQDVKVCFDALMTEYGITYKAPIHLKNCFKEKCATKYKGDVEQMFLEEINTLAHAKVFELMDEACNDFLNYSKATWIRKPLGYGQRIDTFIRQIINN